jgi:hypothetical protein
MELMAKGVNAFIVLPLFMLLASLIVMLITQAVTSLAIQRQNVDDERGECNRTASCRNNYDGR